MTDSTHVTDPYDRQKSYSVCFKKRMLDKTVRKHIRGADGSSTEPWDELISDGTLTSLRSAAKQRTPESPAELRQAILVQADCSCDRPLIVTYREVFPGLPDLLYWALVCPSGLFVVGAVTQRGFQIRSAYFKQQTVHVDGKLRWWKLAEQLVDEYCPTEGGRKYLPESADSRPKRRELNGRFFDICQDQIEFVSPQQWGFRTEGRGARTYFSYDLRTREWRKRCQHVVSPERSKPPCTGGRPRKHSL